MEFINRFPLSICLVLSFVLSMHCHSRLAALNEDRGYNCRAIPSANSLKLVSLGFDKLIADYFWLQFICYVGDIELQRTEKFALADSYLELINQLDPSFVTAYWFAAFVIGGDCGKPSRAAEILDMGIKANPDSWYLPFIAGVNQYLYAGNETAAAKYYRVAAKYPGAPVWLIRQAKILDAKSPRLVKQASSWLNIFRSANNDIVRERAQEQSIWLWVQVYKTAPNEAYRDRAREVLKELGVDVASLKKPE